MSGKKKSNDLLGLSPKGKSCSNAMSSQWMVWTVDSVDDRNKTSKNNIIRAKKVVSLLLCFQRIDGK